MLQIAKILLFFLVVAVAVGAALGAIGTFFGLISISLLLGASNMEGGLAMGAASLAPVGAVLGGLGGGWLAWRLNRHLSRAAIMGIGYGLSVLAMVAGVGWIIFEELNDGDPYETGMEPVLLIEWRLPETVRHDRIGGIFRHSMRSSYMDWPLTTHWDKPRARDEDGKTI